jgi:hypothetical protein
LKFYAFEQGHTEFNPAKNALPLARWRRAAARLSTRAPGPLASASAPTPRAFPRTPSHLPNARAPRRLVPLVARTSHAWSAGPPQAPLRARRPRPLAYGALGSRRPTSRRSEGTPFPPAYKAGRRRPSAHAASRRVCCAEPHHPAHTPPVFAPPHHP